MVPSPRVIHGSVPPTEHINGRWPGATRARRWVSMPQLCHFPAPARPCAAWARARRRRAIRQPCRADGAAGQPTPESLLLIALLAGRLSYADMTAWLHVWPALAVWPAAGS